jgi:hypothetical protein
MRSGWYQTYDPRSSFGPLVVVFALNKGLQFYNTFGSTDRLVQACTNDNIFISLTLPPGFWKIVLFDNIFGSLLPSEIFFCSLNCLILFIEKKYLISCIIK